LQVLKLKHSQIGFKNSYVKMVIKMPLFEMLRKGKEIYEVL